MCPVFLADALYALEMNIRHAAILGYVGAGGVGLLLNEKIAWRDYAKAGMILAMLLVIVVVIEQVGEYLRSRMLLGIKTSDREKMFWTVAFVILILWSLTAVRWPAIPAKGMQILKGILAGLLHPDWTLIFNRTVNGVPWLLLETLCIAIAGTAIGAVLAVPAALVGSYTTFYRYPAFLVRFLMAAVRTMPSIIAGLIFIRVTGPGAFAGLMTMAFLSFGMCSKMFIHTLDGMDRELLAACRSMGLGWPAMMRHVVWPSCKRALHADVWYRLDVNLRDASVLGFVGAGGIGAPLIFAMNGYAWSMAGAYLLGLLVLVLAADGFSSKLSQKDGAE
jgi:phosphonate transport system permease protein